MWVPGKMVFGWKIYGTDVLCSESRRISVVLKFADSHKRLQM